MMSKNGAPKRIVITGANRGLGLDFVRQWLERDEEICALARDPGASESLQALCKSYPEALMTIPCDVADDASVREACARIERRWDTVDLLLNNAGVYGTGRGTPISGLDFDEIRSVFEVNALGAIRMVREVEALLRRAGNARIVNMTSLMGSIEDNGSGGVWAYRMSKAALNMATRNMAHDFASASIPCIVLHPGWVRTDMGGPAAPLGVSEAVASMIETIESVGMEHTGTLLDRNGEAVPW